MSTPDTRTKAQRAFDQVCHLADLYRREARGWHDAPDLATKAQARAEAYAHTALYLREVVEDEAARAASPDPSKPQPEQENNPQQAGQNKSEIREQERAVILDRIATHRRTAAHALDTVATSAEDIQGDAGVSAAIATREALEQYLEDLTGLERLAKEEENRLDLYAHLGKVEGAGVALGYLADIATALANPS